MARPISLPLQAIADAKAYRERLLGASLASAILLFVAFQETRPGGWTPGTVRVARTAYRQILAAVGDKPVAALSMDDTDKAMVAVYSSGTTPQWMQRVRGCWVVFCHWLQRSRVLETDISISWEPIKIAPGIHKREYHDYTEAEIGKLCAYLSEQMQRYVWGSCLAGGLRLANHRALSWRKIEEDRSGRWTVVIPAAEMKGRKELRWPVCSRLRDILGTRGEPEALVWGKLPCESRLISKLRTASRKAGLDARWAYPHQFRRVCCAWLKASGVTRDEAQRLFGWTNQDLMLRHYWPEETDDERRAILDRLG